ncbi:Aste57867_9233 [Aphanomyces stellatus]|uniref:Aste57867_9233 protein n=1 Tax=Aphanomyces stellatus TaxID=120398 RepID=A0A485KMP1_9STRA|nr:hypothetical protein As57867_009197 [Aphanomyces stellatus]VFT86116.1 Aste57867_9233 [Aphanomyces stellatus]
MADGSDAVGQGLVRRFADDGAAEDTKALLQDTDADPTVQQLASPTDLKPKPTKNAPLLWCDGIRGVASQIVFTFHLQYWFLFMEQYYGHTWFRALRAGNAAVEMFLILSGFVLSVRFFERMQVIERACALQDATTVRNVYVDAYHSIASTGLRRVPRLFGPVVIGGVVSIFYTWWRGYAIELGTLSIEMFKTLFIIYPGFNSTLWTLRVELEGSLFTLALCVLLSKLRYHHRVAVCLLALPIFHNQWGDWTGEKSHYFGCFVLGVLMANIITKQKHQLVHGPLPPRALNPAPVFPRAVPNTLGASLETLGISLCYLVYHAWGFVHGIWSATRHAIQRLPSRLETIVTNTAYVSLFLVGGYLFSYRPEYGPEYGLWHDAVHVVFVKEHARMLHRLGSCMILYAVCYSSWLQLFFASRLARYWGRISFLLYVLHWPLVLFLGDYIKPWALARGWSDERAKLFTAAVVYWLAHVLAHLATVYLDEPYVKWLASMEKRLEMKVAIASPIAADAHVA